jgi:predicted secreted protein
MAAFAFTDAYLSINSVDQSDYVKSVTLTVESNLLDSETMGDTWTEKVHGVKSGSLAIEFVDDMADGLIDNDLFDIFGTNVAFELRPTSSSVGPTNPKWTGTVSISSLPVGGSHGELATKSVTWPTSGAVTRAEA